jgi:predicted 3-demethylubiquinone-9 3-methyltransferase (glyoxalase superfamily)
MSKVTPFLWFDGNVDEAVTFYSAIFKNTNVLNISRYGEGAPAPAGTVMSATLEIEGQKLIVFNGGPHFKLTEAFSLFVSCETQDEIDRLWSQLTANGGQPSRCGWLKDRFGLSWQIIPPILMELLQGPDKARAGRVMQAMLKMDKIDIQKLKDA